MHTLTAQASHFFIDSTMESIQTVLSKLESEITDLQDQNHSLKDELRVLKDLKEVERLQRLSSTSRKFFFKLTFSI